MLHDCILSPSDAELDRKALEAFRSSPPAFLLVSAKRKSTRK